MYGNSSSAMHESSVILVQMHTMAHARASHDST